MDLPGIEVKCLRHTTPEHALAERPPRHPGVAAGGREQELGALRCWRRLGARSNAGSEPERLEERENGWKIGCRIIWIYCGYFGCGSSVRDFC